LGVGAGNSQAPEARLKRIDRQQSYWGEIDLETLIPPEHPARAIWELVGQRNLLGFLENNKSVEGRAGAERTDPQLLVSVWVYSLSRGLGSAREIARVMQHEPGLRWLSGDEPVNHHTLSDFRVHYGAGLDQLFSEVLAVLSQAGLVKLEQVTLDGTKVRAQASGKSFRREPTLRRHLEQARAWVQRLSTEEAAAQENRGRQAAQRRAAEQTQARIEQALKELEEIRKTKTSSERGQARASRSEPEARIMKTGDGGFAPSYNVQTTTDAAHKILLDVELTPQASDQQQLQPAIERHRRQQGHAPPQVIVDGGYLSEPNITAMKEQGVDLIGPELEAGQRERSLQQSLQVAGIAPQFGPSAFVIVEQGQALQCPAGQRLARTTDNPRFTQYRARRQDCSGCAQRSQCCPRSQQRTVKIGKRNPVVEEFHQRMKQEASKRVYRIRGAVAEFPHAWLKDKIGLRKFHVRGLVKAGLEAKWAALTYNIQQWFRLCWRPTLAAA
jgi:transposase